MLTDSQGRRIPHDKHGRPISTKAGPLCTCPAYLVTAAADSQRTAPLFKEVIDGIHSYVRSQTLPQSVRVPPAAPAPAAAPNANVPPQAPVGRKTNMPPPAVIPPRKTTMPPPTVTLPRKTDIPPPVSIPLHKKRNPDILAVQRAAIAKSPHKAKLPSKNGKLLPCTWKRPGRSPLSQVFVPDSDWDALVYAPDHKARYFALGVLAQQTDGVPVLTTALSIHEFDRANAVMPPMLAQFLNYTGLNWLHMLTSDRAIPSDEWHFCRDLYHSLKKNGPPKWWYDKWRPAPRLGTPRSHPNDSGDKHRGTLVRAEDKAKGEGRFKYYPPGDWALNVAPPKWIERVKMKREVVEVMDGVQKVKDVEIVPDPKAMTVWMLAAMNLRMTLKVRECVKKKL